jgi:DNA-directed RNA polymerase specialized sigma24 family protein
MAGRPRSDEDEESFAWFFTTEYPSVVRSLCHLVRREDAEDLAQEAFVRLHGRWAKVSRYDRPDAWVRRVAVNLAITHARREGRRRPREAASSDWRPAGGVVAGPGPGTDVVDAVASLPTRDRALVVLYYFEDRPLADVADILELSPGAAKVALHRARNRLARLLAEEVHDESR